MKYLERKNNVLRVFGRWRLSLHSTVCIYTYKETTTVIIYIVYVLTILGLTIFQGQVRLFGPSGPIYKNTLITVYF